MNSTWSRLFDFGTGTTDYMFLTISDGTNVRFAITTSGPGGEQQINAAGVLPLSTWSLVTVTVSGTTGTLYVNGTPVGTNPDISITPASLGTTTQDWIGRSEYAGDPYLDASVDDFNIYNTRAQRGPGRHARVRRGRGGQRGRLQVRRDRRHDRDRLLRQRQQRNDPVRRAGPRTSATPPSTTICGRSRRPNDQPIPRGAGRAGPPLPHHLRSVRRWVDDWLHRSYQAFWTARY